MGDSVDITLNARDVELILDSFESHRQILADAAIRPESEHHRAKIAESQRRIFTLSERLQ